MNGQGRLRTRPASLLEWAGLAAALVPFVVAVARAAFKEWMPVGDAAYFTVRSADVLTAHHPLLGAWSSGSSIVGEREFAIKHALTREVAYESLTTKKRAHFHARFASWLERIGEGRDEDAALLAHHYAEAVRPDNLDLAWPDADEEVAHLRERAVSWLRRAADLAVGRYEIEDGLSLLHRADELEQLLDALVEISRAIARANALYFNRVGFSSAMQRAIELANDDSTTTACRSSAGRPATAGG